MGNNTSKPNPPNENTKISSPVSKSYDSIKKISVDKPKKPSVDKPDIPEYHYINNDDISNKIIEYQYFAIPNKTHDVPKLDVDPFTFSKINDDVNRLFIEAKNSRQYNGVSSVNRITPLTNNIPISYPISNPISTPIVNTYSPTAKILSVGYPSSTNLNSLTKIDNTPRFTNLELSQAEKSILIDYNIALETIDPFLLSNHVKITLEKLRDSYLKLININHPDKGGNIDNYNNILNALEILNMVLAKNLEYSMTNKR